MRVRVVVCDDDPIMRAGLRAFLENEPDVDVVGEAPSAQALQAARLRPDVVLVRMAGPFEGGVGAMRELGDPEAEQSAKFVLLTAPAHDGDAVRALGAGFRGVVHSGGSPDELVHAIRLVASGDQLVMPLSVRRLLLDLAQVHDARGSTKPKDLEALTPRECEVLRLLVRGTSNADIAGELSLSSATVRSHVHHLLAKLGLRNRAQAVAFAYEHGLLRPSCGV